MKKICAGTLVFFDHNGNGPMQRPCPDPGHLIPILSVREASGNVRDFPLTHVYCSPCASNTSVRDLIGVIDPPYHDPSPLWRVIELYFENKQLPPPRMGDVTLRWITSERFVEAMKKHGKPMLGVAVETEETGHGHVYPRKDGAKARCGGPAICAECANDAEQKKQADLAKNKAFEINQKLKAQPPVTGWSGGMAGVGANPADGYADRHGDYGAKRMERLGISGMDAALDADRAKLEAMGADAGITEAELKEAQDERVETINDAVKSGLLTEERGAEILASPHQQAAIFGEGAMRLEHDDAEGVKATPVKHEEMTISGRGEVHIDRLDTSHPVLDPVDGKPYIEQGEGVKVTPTAITTPDPLPISEAEELEEP